jgi:hypothetical protein
MAVPIAEFFGFAADDSSAEAMRHRNERRCPFLDGPCVKFSAGVALGTCSKARGQESPIIICPRRFSAGGEQVARLIAREAEPPTVLAVVPEVPVGRRLGRMDWILAELDAAGRVTGSLYGVEAQAVDTTGSLKPYVEAYFAGADWNFVRHTSGINWRNVWKRIVPQILAKGRLFEALGSRLFVVMQDVLVDYLKNDLGLEEARPGENPNVIFYAFHLAPKVPGPGFELELAERFETTLRRIERAVGDVASLPSRSDVVASVERRVQEAGVGERAGVAIVRRPPDGAADVSESGADGD